MFSEERHCSAMFDVMFFICMFSEERHCFVMFDVMFFLCMFSEERHCFDYDEEATVLKQGAFIRVPAGAFSVSFFRCTHL